MSVIQCYHPDVIWEKRYLENEDIENIMFFGIELEIESDSNNDNPHQEMVDIIETYLNQHGMSKLFVYERDGSLNEGFEIVTHPMSWNYYEEHNKNFKDILSLLSNGGYHSHNGGRCGLHVHVNRKYFGFSQQDLDKYRQWGLTSSDLTQLNNSKIEESINNCAFIFEKFKEDFIKLSCRKVFDYCSFLLNSVDNSVDPNSLDRDLILQRLDRSDRYKVVNIRNYYTIEFRLMRGTLLFVSFDTKIRAIKNVVEVAKSSTGIYNFRDITTYLETTEKKEIMESYFQDRDIAESKEYISLNSKKEYRISNENFILRKRLMEV